jgi:transcriptional regulator with XRE-family HTH domain
MRELIGKLILLLRTKKKESQEAYGDRFGYTDASYICKLERGKANFDAELLDQIFADGNFEITALKGKFKDGEEVWIEVGKKE